MADSVDIYQEMRDRAHNDWQRNFVLPYGSAYSTARKSFLGVLEAQDKADKERQKQQMELAMFALSLTGGSLLTFVFGSAAVKDGAAKIALDVICEHEMNRAFKVAAFVEENKTAQFAIGQLWDKAGSHISAELKNSLTENSGNFVSLGQFTQEPQNLQNHLEKWVRDAYARVMQAGEEFIRGSQNASLQQLVTAPFFTQAPTQAKNEGEMAKDIELSFFMKLILELDRLQKGYYKKHRGARVRVVTSRSEIDKLPSDESYPASKSHTVPGHKPTGARRRVEKSTPDVTYFERVEYKSIGKLIAERINALYKHRFSEDFFKIHELPGWVEFLGGGNVGTGKATLEKAEQTLKELGNRNYSMIEKLAKLKGPLPK